MSQKKTISANESKSAVGSGRRLTAKDEGTQSPIVKKPLQDGSTTAKQATTNVLLGRKRILSQEAIGTVSGEVWQVLADRGGLSLPALKKSLDAPADLVLAALGWLAREGKLEFIISGRSVKVSLRSP
jgi:hypothetical protein